MRARTSRRLVHLVIAAGLAAAGCNDATDTSVGRFDAELSGAVEQSYEGPALILRHSSIGYAVAMESDAFQGPAHISIYLLRESATTPAVGSHDIVDAEGTIEETEFGGNIVVGTETPDERTCYTLEGTITFTRSSGSSGAGSYEFTMSCTLTDDPEGEPETITVTGTFDAPVATQL